MTTHKQLTYVAVAVVALISAVMLTNSRGDALTVVQPVKELAGAALAPALSSASSSPRVVSPASTTAVVESASNASIVVVGKVYPIEVRSGETVLEAMRGVSSSSGFAFTGRDYPGLGFFVESIGGVKSGGGKYWVFYVNGVSASKGVSNQTLTAGDRVEWKLEKSY